MRGVIPRRAALSYGLALAVSVLAQDALARRLSGLGGIRVDVTPLRANVGDPTAILAERELPGALARSLAGRAPRARLVVRIDTLALGPKTPASVHGGSSPDNIGGGVISTTRSFRLARRRIMKKRGAQLQSEAASPLLYPVAVELLQAPPDQGRGRRNAACAASLERPLKALESKAAERPD